MRFDDGNFVEDNFLSLTAITVMMLKVNYMAML